MGLASHFTRPAAAIRINFQSNTSALVPKSVKPLQQALLRTSERKGHWQTLDSSAAFDLKFLKNPPQDRRNFKSAALA